MPDTYEELILKWERVVDALKDAKSACNNVSFDNSDHTPYVEVIADIIVEANERLDNIYAAKVRSERKR